MPLLASIWHFCAVGSHLKSSGWLEQPPCDLPQLLFIDKFLSSSIRILQNSISSSAYHQKRISIDFSKEQLCKLQCPSSQPTNTRIKYSNKKNVTLFHKISVRNFRNQHPTSAPTFISRSKNSRRRTHSDAGRRFVVWRGSLSFLQWIWQILKRPREEWITTNRGRWESIWQLLTLPESNSKFSSPLKNWWVGKNIF